MPRSSQNYDREFKEDAFIEEAVRAHLLELSAEQAKAANIDISEPNLTAIINDAVNWARR